jgi:hypothetical protein
VTRRVVRLARKLLRWELNGWRDLYRWVFRRPRVDPGAEGFGYLGPVRPILITFISLSVVEVVAVDLIMQRWPSVRLAILILGIWGVTFMLGYTAGLVTTPHSVGPAGLRIRYSHSFDLCINWSDVAAARTQWQGLADSKTFQLRPSSAGPVLHIPMGSETNTAVTLRQPITVPLPTGEVSVVAVHFHADDAKGLVQSAQRHLVEVRER